MAFLQLIRAPNVLTSASNILAAYLLAATVFSPSLNQTTSQLTDLILLVIASALLYSGGMIMNDCFDYDEDLRERPHRPLPSGAITLSRAWQLCCAALILGLLTAAWVGITQFIIASTLAVLIILYNGIAKQTVWAPWIMGSCRYSNWLLGLSLLGLQTSSFIIALPVLLYVSGLTMLSRVETTAHNTQPLLHAVLLISASAALITLLIISEVLTGTWALVVLLAAELLILYLSYMTWHNFTPPRIQLMVKTLVIGIIPLDAILVWAGGNMWGGLLVLSLLAPVQLAAKRLYIT